MVEVLQPLKLLRDMNFMTKLHLEYKLNQTYQKFNGFGVSGAWWSSNIGDWKIVDHIIELIFDPIKGLGASIYRYNIGAGEQSFQDTWRRTQTFMNPDKSLDFFKDENAVKILKKICQYPLSELVFFVNSPPKFITKNLKGFGDSRGLSNLDKVNYEVFANYCFDVVSHFINHENIKVTHLSPINEPSWLWSKVNHQEGCHYSVSEVREVIETFVRVKKQREMDIIISVPESSDFINAFLYAEEIFNNSLINEEIDVFDGHSYWTDANAKQLFYSFFNRVYPDKKLAMSEWCHMKQGNDYGMNSALIMAETIFEDLTILQVISWQFWLGVSKYDFNDGLLYVNEEKQSLEKIPKRYYVFGQFSKFIRPGFERFYIQPNRDDIKVVGFVKDFEIVIVIINSTTNTHTIEFDWIESAKAYVTNQDNNLQEVKVYNKLTLLGHSVYTVTGKTL